MGMVETTVDAITKTGHHGLSLTLSGAGSKAGSQLNVMWEPANPGMRGSVTLSLTGHNLANRAGMLSKNDPFWQLYKRRADGVHVLVAKSGACAVQHDASGLHHTGAPTLALTDARCRCARHRWQQRW